MRLDIGDRVKVTRDVSGRRVQGMHGTIVYNQGHDYGVEFDDWYGGHSCDGYGADEKCLWVDPMDVRRVGKKKSGLTKFLERVA